MKAPCPHFSKCSGCTLQQFPYVKQLYDKSKRILSQFQNLVPEDRPLHTCILPIVASPKEFQYRISTKLCLHQDQAGQRRIGLYHRGSKQVVDIPNCPVHHPDINRLLSRMFSPKRSLPAPFYQHNRRAFQSGRLKFITIRYCPETQSFGLIVSHTGVGHEELRSWVLALRLPRTSLYVSELTQADGDLVLSRNIEHLAGPSRFPLHLDHHTFDLDPSVFFQANHSLSQQFIQHIVSGLRGHTLLDLYGGFGAYSLAAAGSFQRVYLVEANKASIEAAQRSLGPQQDTEVLFCAEKVETFLKRLATTPTAKHVSDVIVNPPRGGLSPAVLRALTSSAFSQVQRLHYVSCNPETLKRDLQQLTQGNARFLLQTLTPFDMFPQTDHVECVAKLERRTALQERTRQTPRTSIPKRSTGRGPRRT